MLPVPVTLSTPLSIATYYGGVAFGSLLPDIDHPGSYIGRRSFGLADIIYNLCGHRGITHSAIIWILIFLPSLFFYPNPLVYGIAIGYLGHILGDSFSLSGVPLLLPFTDKKTNMKITYRTGGTGEMIIFIVTCIVLFSIVFFNLQYFLEI